MRSVRNTIVFFADVIVRIGTSVHVSLGCNLLMNIHYEFLKGKKRCFTVVLEFFNYLPDLVEKKAYPYFIKAFDSVLKNSMMFKENQNTTQKGRVN